MLKTKYIESRVADNVLYLTLNRPEVRNALSAEMVQEVLDAFGDVNEGGVRAVVICGAGGNFCAGGDIKDMSALLQTKDAPWHDKKNVKKIAEYNALAGQLFQTILDATPAVVTVLEGAVFGGGMGLACACDVAISLSTAKFGLPETSLGLIPAQVAPYVKHRLGDSNARLLGVLGGQIDAPEAYRIGLVHYLVDDEAALEEKLSEVLKKIRACAPQALSTTRQLMLSGPTQAFDHEGLARIFAEAMVGEEGKEGLAAFMAKRRPNWNHSASH